MDTLILKIYFLIIKIDNFRGDLSGISAKTATLLLTHWCCEKEFLSDRSIPNMLNLLLKTKSLPVTHMVAVRFYALASRIVSSTVSGVCYWCVLHPIQEVADRHGSSHVRSRIRILRISRPPLGGCTKLRFVCLTEGASNFREGVELRRHDQLCVHFPESLHELWNSPTEKHVVRVGKHDQRLYRQYSHKLLHSIPRG